MTHLYDNFPPPPPSFGFIFFDSFFKWQWVYNIPCRKNNSPATSLCPKTGAWNKSYLMQFLLIKNKMSSTFATASAPLSNTFLTREKLHFDWSLIGVRNKSYNFSHMMIGTIFLRSVLVDTFPAYLSSTTHILLVEAFHDNSKQRGNIAGLEKGHGRTLNSAYSSN